MGISVEHENNGKRWRLVAKGDDTEELDRALTFFKGLDAHTVEKQAKRSAMPTTIVPATEYKPVSDRRTPLKRDDGKAKQLASSVYQMWNEWYAILKEKHLTIPKPVSPPPEDMKHVSAILKEYGPDITKEIFKVAVMDWDALRSRNQRLPEVPTLRQVMYNRAELAIGVGKKGLTSSKHRVSAYGEEAGGGYDDWKKIKGSDQ